MYLHLGQDTVIRAADIVGVFDLEKTSTGRITREFLAGAEKGLLVTNVSSDLPKSFVLCDGEEGTRVYISQISSSTLKKRAGFIDEISNV